MSDEFALDRLMPVLLANASLQHLTLADDDDEEDDDEEGAVSLVLRHLEQLVQERTAARGAAMPAALPHATE